MKSSTTSAVNVPTWISTCSSLSSKVVLKENPTSSTSSSSGKTKLKQVILDYIFPRKRKIEETGSKTRKIEETTKTENDERLQQ
jgi:hypothetical protein